MNAPDRQLTVPLMRKVSEMKDTKFDGKVYGYVPPKKLAISPKLKLHTRQDTDIDPITYEVIRHSLWQSTKSTARPSSASRARRWRCTRWT
jgi:hypothetical protein